MSDSELKEKPWERLLELVESGDDTLLLDFLNSMSPMDTALAISRLRMEAQGRLFSRLVCTQATLAYWRGVPLACPGGSSQSRAATCGTHRSESPRLCRPVAHLGRLCGTCGLGQDGPNVAAQALSAHGRAPKIQFRRSDPKSGSALRSPT